MRASNYRGILISSFPSCDPHWIQTFSIIWLIFLPIHDLFYYLQSFGVCNKQSCLGYVRVHSLHCSFISIFRCIWREGAWTSQTWFQDRFTVYATTKPTVCNVISMLCPVYNRKSHSIARVPPGTNDFIPTWTRLNDICSSIVKSFHCEKLSARSAELRLSRFEVHITR